MKRFLSTVIVFSMACGAGAAESSGSASTSSGGEAGPPVAAKQPETEPETEPEATSDVPPASEPVAGPATVIITVKVANEPIDATVEVLDAGQVVAEGESGKPIQVTSGTYEFRSKITDPKAVYGSPKKTSDPMTVEKGATLQATLEIPAAKVRLRVLKRGKPVRGATVKLQRSGSSEVVAEFPVTDDYVRVAAGRFDATIVMKGEQVEVKGLVFPGGSTREMPINID